MLPGGSRRRGRLTIVAEHLELSGFEIDEQERIMRKRDPRARVVALRFGRSAGSASSHANSRRALQWGPGSCAQHSARLLAALLLPKVLDRIAERTVMLVGGAVMALGMVGGMMMPSLAGLLAIWFLIGIGSSLVQTPGGRLLRRSSHEEDRPALFSAQFALSHACWLVTYLVAGVVGNEIGLFWTFGLLGLLAVVSSGLAMRLWPFPDPELLEHEHAALRHEHLHVHDEHHQHEHKGWEGPEPHRHPHRHVPQRHRHPYVIDMHHQHWPA
jgi:hypothetical protein